MLALDNFTVFLFACLYGIIVLVSQIFTKKSRASLLLYGIIFFYLVMVMKYTLLPIPVESRYLEHFRQSNSFSSSIRFLPLWADTQFHLLRKEPILNIFLTMPFGFFLNYFVRPSYKKMVVWGLLFGGCVETMQLFIGLGIRCAYRTIDINDIILNMTGAVIGFMLFRIFVRLQLLRAVL